ncbi:MAG: hypothetical protein ABIJ09_02265 [Pseudomonadota bacterium]
MKRALLALVAMSLALPAAAQNADLGLKLGEKSRLHLGADLGTGFDTNPNYRPFAQPFVGDLTLAFRPQLKLSIPSDMLSVEAGVRANYQQYFGLMDARTGKVNQLDGDANLELEVNRKGFFGVALRDMLTRAVDPGYAALGSQLARTRNDLSLGAELRPGGGLLTFALIYGFGIEIYDPARTNNFLDFIGISPEVSQIANPDDFNNMEHKLKLRTEWRFLPKTGFFLDIYGGSFTYLSANSPNVANFPVGIEIGAMGQLTGKISGVAKLGYTNPLIFSSSGQLTTATFIGAIGQLEARYALTEMNTFTLGIRREMRPVYMYQFFTDNRVYFETSHQLFQRLQLKANAAYALLAFDQAVSATGQANIQGGGNRMDHLIEGNLSARFFILDWFSIGASDMLQLRFTNASGSDNNSNFSYWKNLTMLTLTAYY